MSVTLSEAETKYLKGLVPEIAERIIYIDGKPLQLEREWQWNLVGSVSAWEAWNKARQMGYSFGTAIRALLRAHLFPPMSYNAVLVSINREEAREKIRYIEELMDGMKEKKKTKIANKLEIEWVNGNRVQSFPSRPVRGIPNVDLHLDEFAHIKEAREIYSGSTASTVRQCYGVTVGSTPFGRGMFHEICRGAGQVGEYRSFLYHEIPWWFSHILCKDPWKAKMFAEGMTTLERVQEFGTANLIAEFDNLSLDMFQQEFECSFMDSSNSALSEELILSSCDGTIPCAVLDIPCDDKSIDVMEVVSTALQVMGFEEDYHSIYLGCDVGRKVHATEIILTDWFGGRLKSRAYITLRRAPFPLQKEVIRYLVKNLPLKKAIIDQQGIGNQLAEELVMEFPSKVEGMDFTQQSKTVMVNALVKAFEERILTIYPTHRIQQQLLEVRKVFSVDGRVLYRAAVTKEEAHDEDYKSHADLFWALAMSVVAAGDVILDRGPKITKRGPALVRAAANSGIVIARHMPVPSRFG